MCGLFEEDNDQRYTYMKKKKKKISDDVDYNELVYQTRSCNVTYLYKIFIQTQVMQKKSRKNF